MSSSVYAVGRPLNAGQRLKDGSIQLDLCNLRRDSLFWSKVEHLVASWCEKQFSRDVRFAKQSCEFVSIMRYNFHAKLSKLP